MLSIAACGPQPGAGDGPPTDESSSTTTSDEPTTITGASSSADATSSDPDTPSSGSSGTVDDTTDEGSSGIEPETCVVGSFVGLYTPGFEGDSFESCDTGEFWFISIANVTSMCPSEFWIRVEGELCGPGPYGPFGQLGYWLEGEVVQGPCEAACGEEPAEDACTPFEQLCPFFECDPLAQDCARGTRCVPQSGAGAPPWTETRCKPEPQPAQPLGAACTTSGPWQDDCAAGGFCVDDGSGMGTCMPLCLPVNLECDVGSCSACDFAEEPAVGVCGEAAVSC